MKYSYAAAALALPALALADSTVTVRSAPRVGNDVAPVDITIPLNVFASPAGNGTFGTVSLKVVGCNDADITSITCIAYSGVNGTGAGHSQPFSSNSTANLATNPVVVGSIKCTGNVAQGQSSQPIGGGATSTQTWAAGNGAAITSTLTSTVAAPTTFATGASTGAPAAPTNGTTVNTPTAPSPTSTSGTNPAAPSHTGAASAVAVSAMGGLLAVAAALFAL